MIAQELVRCGPVAIATAWEERTLFRRKGKKREEERNWNAMSLRTMYYMCQPFIMELVLVTVYRLRHHLGGVGGATYRINLIMKDLMMK